MMQYPDGAEVRVGDHVRLAQAEALVETLIEGHEIADWGLDAPGFMILDDRGERFLIEPGSYSWEDVAFVGRGD